jgi:hypothetical protein
MTMKEAAVKAAVKAVEIGERMPGKTVKASLSRP